MYEYDPFFFFFSPLFIHGERLHYPDALIKAPLLNVIGYPWLEGRWKKMVRDPGTKKTPGVRWSADGFLGVKMLSECKKTTLTSHPQDHGCVTFNKVIMVRGKVPVLRRLKMVYLSAHGCFPSGLLIHGSKKKRSQSWRLPNWNV